MKILNRALLIIVCFTWISINSQSQKPNSDLNSNSGKTMIEVLPKISKDSTKSEITAHVKAMIDWMTTEHFKSRYVQTLVYAEKGIYLAKKTGNKKYLNNVRVIIGNTLLRINDTAGAKKIFLKSLEEAREANDTLSILKFTGNLANIYIYNPKYKHKAIKKYSESIKIAELLKDTARLFIVNHNLSRIYNEIKQPENSFTYIKKTEYYLKQLGNPPHYKASHLHNEGRMHLLLNNPDKAIEKFKQTIALCENTDFVDALIEGYKGLREALIMKKDYEGIYNINKKLEVYEVEKDKNEDKNITDAVSAKLNVERYKEQIKSKELEEVILKQKASRKNILIIFILGVAISLVIGLLSTYFAYKKRKILVKNLQGKNKQYLIAKEESELLAKSRANFFATVSHELRTPLYGVIGLSSILLENKELKKHEQDLQSLKFSANYLLALINDLLQMNKIDNNSFTKKETTFNLREQIKTIVASFEYIRLQHNNTIKIDIADNVPSQLKGNSVMLSQILMNLVGNACKFTENGYIKIIISVKNKNKKFANLKFIIKDNGPGIENKKLKDIFNEFTQINSSANTYQGTGLGLPIVKKLLNQAGSSISVVSKLNKGSSFKFRMSFKIISDFKEIAAVAVDEVAHLANKFILVVEDNRINQIVTKKILKTARIHCDIAGNGEEAVFMAKKNTYDLILMDINMPVKNGIEATEEIRMFDKNTPIIALTAVEIEEQKHRIFRSGMNDIVVKPYDIELFKQILVENLLHDKRKILKKTS